MRSVRGNRASRASRAGLPVLLLALLPMVVAACAFPSPPFECQSDAQCNLASAGVCLSSSNAGARSCAYPDSDCPSGQRWGDNTIDGDIRGVCVVARNWAILSANGSVAQPQPLRLYTQDDTGTFQSAWQSAEVGAHLAVAWGDYDGDGDLDFGTGLEGTDRIYRNEAGSFVVAWTAPTTSRTVDVHWDDVDGDGDVDLLASGTGGVKIYRNTSGGFVTGDLVAGSFLGATEVVDMDNDGDRDLVTTSLDSVFVYLNNRGIYSLLWTGPVDEPYDIACADYDGDGDQDVAVGVWKGFRIYRQNGGTFVRAVSSETDLQPPTTNTAWAIAWIDSDSDGDPDLFTAQVDETGTPQRPAPAQLYKNTGGTFSIGWTSSETIFPTTVSVADFDHDGKPDLAIGSTPTATNPAHTNLYRNLGGAFALEWTSTDGENANDLAWTPL